MSHKKSNAQPQMWSVILILACFIAISVGLCFIVSPEDIRASIERAGILAPLLYIALFAILPIFLFPVPALVIAAGIAFGLFWGSVYTCIGVCINALIMFALARSLLRERLERWATDKVPPQMAARLYTTNQPALTQAFFIMRLIPLISYNALNYLGGLSRITLPNYMISTLLGTLPGIIIFINTGDKSTQASSLSFVISLVLLVALVVISSLGARYYLSKNDND